MEEAAARPGRTGYTEADTAFHRALLDASGNRLLGSLGRAVAVALEHSFAVSSQTPGAVESSLPAHRAVADAVARGDAEAAAAAMEGIIAAAEEETARSPGMPVAEPMEGSADHGGRKERRPPQNADAHQ